MKKIRFECDIQDSIPKIIKTDEKRLKQILFNLIGNALKFTQKGFIQVKAWAERKPIAYRDSFSEMVQ